MPAVKLAFPEAASQVFEFLFCDNLCQIFDTVRRPTANAFHYPPLDATSLRAGCCLTSVGALAYRSGQKYPQSGHPKDFDFRWQRGRKLPDFALVLIVAGRGQWETERGGLQSVAAGDAFYLVPGGWHRYRPSPAAGWTEKWICLQGASLHGLVVSGLLPDDCLHLRGGIRPRMEPRLDRLLRDVASEPGVNHPSWGLRALTIMLECFETESPRVEPAARSGATEEAMRFIRENAHRPIGVRDVAAQCGIERRTLERRFAGAGLPPIGRSIIMQRIARAELLLTETAMQVKEVAYACGFGSPQRMIYDFRRMLGTTPGRLKARKTH
ncbi:MAG: AraC family transcriptional regulator [Chthoniobacterales bacterium]|nr:AraC family transcriptional regulator [Chthoniobacterales bacterium]